MYDQRWPADWMETEYGYKPHLLAFAWSPA